MLQGAGIVSVSEVIGSISTAPDDVSCVYKLSTRDVVDCFCGDV